ncbi:unnamed protein product, partial [Closterium sp. Yama58-4]
MADQLVVVGLAPVPFDSLKRLQVKLKGEEGDDEEQTQKGPQTQALKERLLDLLGPDVAIEIVEDSVLDVICTDSMKKAVKKTLKKEKKSMNKKLLPSFAAFVSQTLNMAKLLRGIEIGDDFFTVTIKLDHGERLRLPSTCVLTEAGFMPVPGTIRSREMQSMFANIGSDFSFSFLGAGNVQFKNTEAGSLPVMVQTTAWTTAKGIVLLSSADALSARSLAFSRPSLSGFRRPKPALPIIREPPKPAHSDIQTDKNDDEPTGERPELAKKPDPVPAVVKLSIPTFTAWKQRASSGVSAKLTKSSTLNTKDASLKQSSAAASTKENKEPAVSAAKNKKLDVDKPPPKKAKTSHTPGKVRVCKQVLESHMSLNCVLRRLWMLQINQRLLAKRNQRQRLKMRTFPPL